MEIMKIIILNWANRLKERSKEEKEKKSEWFKTLKILLIKDSSKLNNI